MHRAGPARLRALATDGELPKEEPRGPQREHHRRTGKPNVERLREVVGQADAAARDMVRVSERNGRGENYPGRDRESDGRPSSSLAA